MKEFNVNKALSQMNQFRTDNKKKGNYGEEAVLAVVQQYQQHRGGVIFHSYTYPYSQYRDGRLVEGNIKREDNGNLLHISGSKSTKDEIDILYVTDFRVFVIEAKARSGMWRLYDFWVKQRNKEVDKSPLAQTEKHARHLYHKLWEYLPDNGDENYIVPITVFVDKATVEDTRSIEHRKYIHIAILNTLKKKITELDVPLGHRLDVQLIEKSLRRDGTAEKILK